MNVGPTSRGYLDYRAEEALKVFADWMKYNNRSILWSHDGRTSIQRTQ